uniref:Glycosyl hydrolase family 13 catalytic domain-containing protein n=1 Tax=blood disease bacterium R229 TaxID=741978 RepID=G2ZKQ4_9RALS|nr:conserved hypothetical protein [blood disease bacterium R229]
MTDPKTFATPASRTPPSATPRTRRAADSTERPAARRNTPAAEAPARAHPVEARRARPEVQRGAAVFTPAICYLHPLQHGPLDQWGGLLDRIASLGFDHVLIPPPFAVSAGGNVFVTRDHALLHAALGGGPADAALGRLADDCRQRGLTLLMDLVIDRVATDAPLRADHPDWFTRHAERGDALDPRLPPSHLEVASFRHDDAHCADAIGAWWTQQLCAWAALGIGGFRCEAPARLPPARWRPLIAATRESAGARPVRFLAWTPGLDGPAVDALAEAGFDATFSSLRWWDFRAGWMVEEHARLAAIAPPIATAEVPFGTRYGQAFGDAMARERAYRRMLDVADVLGAGWLMPFGFERGALLPMLPERGDPTDQQWIDAHAAFDLCDAVRDVNATLRAAQAAGTVALRADLRMLTGPDARMSALLRADGPDLRADDAATLLVINPDLHAGVSAHADRFLPGRGGRLHARRGARPADRAGRQPRRCPARRGAPAGGDRPAAGRRAGLARVPQPSGPAAARHRARRPAHPCSPGRCGQRARRRRHCRAVHCHRTRDPCRGRRPLRRQAAGGRRHPDRGRHADGRARPAGRGTAVARGRHHHLAARADGAAGQRPLARRLPARTAGTACLRRGRLARCLRHLPRRAGEEARRRRGRERRTGRRRAAGGAGGRPRAQGCAGGRAAPIGGPAQGHRPGRPASAQAAAGPGHRARDGAGLALPAVSCAQRAVSARGGAQRRRLRQLVRTVPALGQRRRTAARHLPGRGAQAGDDPRDGLRRAVLPAHPPHRPHQPQGAQQQPARGARRAGQPLRDRRGGRRARCHPPAARHAGGFPPAARCRPRPGAGAGARLRHPVLARPPLAARAPRLVRLAPRRQRQVRRKPAQEIRRHRQRRFLCPGRQTRALARTARRGDVLGRRGRAAVPRRQSAHQAAAVLGMDDWRGARALSGCDLPVGGLHAAQGDVPAGQGGLLAVVHLLHVAPQQAGVHRLPDRADPHAGARVFPAALLRQHARYQSGVPADLGPAGLPDPRGAGGHPVRAVGRL